MLPIHNLKRAEGIECALLQNLYSPTIQAVPDKDLFEIAKVFWRLPGLNLVAPDVERRRDLFLEET
jgi:hypothetical protein